MAHTQDDATSPNPASPPPTDDVGGDALGTAALFCAKSKKFISDIPEDATSWVCPDCRTRWELYHCVHCGSPVQVPQYTYTVSCPICHKKWKTRKAVAAIAAEVEAATTDRGFTPKTHVPDSRFLSACKVLGGYGHSFPAGSFCNMFFGPDSIRVSGEAPTVALPYDRGTTLEIGGPGEVTSGGGFFGGGFGAQGAAEGMVISSVLNALTTKTDIQTVVGIESDDCQIIALCETATPEQLKLSLAPVYGHIKAAQQKATETASHSSGLVEQLERLAGGCPEPRGTSPAALT